MPPPSPFALTARRHRTIAALLGEHSAFLRELVDSLGSPLHIVVPAIFAENVEALRRVLVARRVEGSILFAKKANKADCFVRSAARRGIGADVASTGELTGALAAGIAGDRIGVSGPEKDDALLVLALQHRCLIAVDALTELERLADLAWRLDAIARLLLRCRMDSQRHSRFGLTASERETALDLCRRHDQVIETEGFAFHLGGYSTADRAIVADTMIDWCVAAQESGLPHCRTIDIGGGLPVRYVDADRWAAFRRQDVPDHYHASPAFGGFYPYGVERAGADALDDILGASGASGESLADRARRHGIHLIVEPGRALLDQAGFTLFRVQGMKSRRGNDGYDIVTVQGSSLSLSEQWFNSEFLPDPVLLCPDEADAVPSIACVAGSTCLENDMLTWRKIGFPRALRRGDLLAYINTAGYQMDSNESSFHDAALPLKVVLDIGGGGERPAWHLDDSRSGRGEHGR